MTVLQSKSSGAQIKHPQLRHWNNFFQMNEQYILRILRKNIRYMDHSQYAFICVHILHSHNVYITVICSEYVYIFTML